MTDTDDDVDVVQLNAVYEGFFRIDRYKVRHKVFETGQWSGELDREVFERGHAVSVLPYDPNRDEVVLIEQFRVGGYAAPNLSHWQIECVAGIIDDGDSAEETAIRETREETGLNVTNLVEAYHYLCSPGGSSETVRMYCGQVDAANAGGIHGLEHEGEFIRVFSVTADEAFATLDDGKINNGMTIIALQWLRTHRDELKRKWASG
ncbi:MAG: NUDIX domain-containing protein [Proteobacteria bacterium]|nr:NUDIX domain-containing protein [Pseudomonadota bacterium]